MVRAFSRVRTASLMAAAVFAAEGCQKGPKPQTITVGQLAAEMKSNDPPRLYDANGDSTRHEYGVIPSATLLPSSEHYSLELLPPSKAAPLVFYCASTWCGAAEMAASRALQAGYKAVDVLPDGIKGWTEAGMPTMKAD
ncbi:MAG TPA: rhodanese-like domain-containing protein [Polyangiaceae bacterium]|jgi:rhodanese-related sulfurtransferase|nr:rhodanese-like domain-containing protein [Polyangiaceae bacterium]